MIYLIDSDALIQAYRYDFPPHNPGDFWRWLEDGAAGHEIIICQKVLDEIERGNDGLYEFLRGIEGIRREAVASALPHIAAVLATYGELDAVDLEVIDDKADPYLVAHAIELGAIVVTNEAPQPGITAPRNKKIPDICAIMQVPCVRYPRFLWDMNHTSG